MMPADRDLETLLAAFDRDWWHYLPCGELEVLDLILGEAETAVLGEGQMDAIRKLKEKARVRMLLGLSRSDCGARRENPDCRCLTEALEELSAGGELPNADTVRKLGQKRHRRRKPLRTPCRLSPVKPEPAPVAQVEPSPPPLTVTRYAHAAWFAAALPSRRTAASAVNRSV